MRNFPLVDDLISCAINRGRNQWPLQEQPQGSSDRPLPCVYNGNRVRSSGGQIDLKRRSLTKQEGKPNCFLARTHSHSALEQRETGN
ncbi:MULTISPECIES: hypothetical protein [Planktothricoides]|uniref:Uncharacterized protein n=2 Tax=Planktothricoides raciborskii TaxID=132608 RepID=A0AAU8JGD6_9CYAN|nr:MULTISPECIES: hypothetical protein [Planktothricoides]MBD2544762.1 hypothetical protein [Planktothricoides raciborskii FACHB-1370]MBD2582831.1 hypothetical protein [Planktothricoides raciborskii FACHB-1261]